MPSTVTPSVVLSIKASTTGTMKRAWKSSTVRAEETRAATSSNGLSGNR